VAGRLERRGPLLLSYAVDQQVRELLEATFGSAPLTPGEFAVYSVLHLTGPTTPSELALDLGMGRSTLSNWLRRMDSRGHLRRRRNPDDGRSQLVQLTAAGGRLTERCFPSFSLAIETFREALDVDEDVLLDALESMSSALTAAVARLQEGQSRPAALSAR
jgi:DNA-binding MarR family transcriptional regulator